MQNYFRTKIYDITDVSTGQTDTLTRRHWRKKQQTIPSVYKICFQQNENIYYAWFHHYHPENE